MRRVVALTATLAVFGVSAPAAAASLTGAEKRAIRPTAIEVHGTDPAGVVVTVRFAGDFAARFGRGGLKRAVAAFILQPKSAGRPAGLLISGPGPLGTIIRHTQSTRVAAIRDGRELTFVVAGPGFAQVDAAQVVVYAEPPGAGGGGARAAADSWPAILKAAASGDGVRAVGLVSAVDCADLMAVRDAIQARLQELSQPGYILQVAFALAGSRRTTLEDYVALLEEQASVLRATGREVERQLVERCGQPAGAVLAGSFAWRPAGPNEIKLTGLFSGPPGSTLSGIRVHLPPGFPITNYLAPVQFPHAQVDGETVTFDGGQAAPGETIETNVRSNHELPPDAAVNVEGSETGTGDYKVPATTSRSDSPPHPPTAPAPPALDPVKSAAIKVLAVNSAAAGGTLVATIVAGVAFPPSLLVTGPLLLLEGVAIGYSNRLANDPPDASFGSIAEPKPPSVALVRPGRALKRSGAAAMDGLLIGLRSEAASLEALLHAVERTQGASASGDATAQLRQELAAASFAREAAAALDAAATLRRSVRRGLAHGRLARKVPAARANALLAKGLSGKLLSGLRRGGLTAAEISALERSLPKFTGPVRFPDVLVDAGRSRAERAMATALRSYADALDRSAVHG